MHPRHQLLVAPIALLCACSQANPIRGADTGSGVDTLGSSGGDETSSGGDDPPTTGGPGGPTSEADGTASADGGDPVCGDGHRDPGEICDGADLGDKQCADVDAAYIGGTLACAADCGALDLSGCEVDVAAALVTLNELTAKGALDGPYADMGDAVELYNAGGAEADLSGWQLSDDPRFPADKTYVFPPGSVLVPGAFLVLVAFDDVAMTGELPFGISDDKEETLTLIDADAAVRDELTFAGADAALSYCRLPDGTGAWQTCAQTFGSANAGASATCGDGAIDPGEDCDGAELGGQTCEGLDLGFTGGTLACGPDCSFDASMCESEAIALNELESTDDAIELYNAGNQPIDISGWILTDDIVDQDYDPAGDLEKLVFAPQTTLAAKQFLVVEKGKDPGQHIFGLGADGDTVTLLRPNLAPVDQVSYAVDEAVTSYCRLPDGPGGAWTADCEATLGAANAGP